MRSTSEPPQAPTNTKTKLRFKPSPGLKSRPSTKNPGALKNPPHTSEVVPRSRKTNAEKSNLYTPPPVDGGGNLPTQKPPLSAAPKGGMSGTRKGARTNENRTAEATEVDPMELAEAILTPLELECNNSGTVIDHGPPPAKGKVQDTQPSTTENSPQGPRADNLTTPIMPNPLNE